MSQAPFMPLATDAYLADTTHLTTEEHGAYLLILLATWRNNGEPLPNDDIRISRVIRCTVKRWKTKIRPTVIQFFDVSDGTLRQKRLEKAWIDVAKNIQQKSQAGQASALKRKEITPTAAQRPSNGKSTNHNHNQNSRKKVYSSDSDFDLFWNLVPKKISKAAAKKAFMSAIKKIDLNTILEGITRYANETNGRESQFIKHPATWLNQECWSDEKGANGDGGSRLADGRAAILHAAGIDASGRVSQNQRSIVQIDGKFTDSRRN
tara:strand:- start:24 stop:815 length:792 start_codon:yes stop_codon:yes gene_type:complete